MERTFGYVFRLEHRVSLAGRYQRRGETLLYLQDQTGNMSQQPSQNSRLQKPPIWLIKSQKVIPCHGIRRTYSSDQSTLVATQLANNVQSCSRYSVAAGRLSSERPGNVIPISKTFPLLGYNHCFSHWTFLKRIKIHLAVPTPTTSPLHNRHQQLASNLVTTIRSSG